MSMSSVRPKMTMRGLLISWRPRRRARRGRRASRVDELGLGAAKLVEHGEELLELALGVAVELCLLERQRRLVGEEGEGAHVVFAKGAGREVSLTFSVPTIRSSMRSGTEMAELISSSRLRTVWSCLSVSSR